MNRINPFRSKKTENDATGARAQASQEEETRQGKRKKKKRKFRIRLIPIWLRLIIVILLLALSLIAGAMVGYGVIGEGDPMDVFQRETWQHILDIVDEKVK